MIKKIWLALVLLLSCAVSQANARGAHRESGTSGASFLNVYPGAKFEAMGAAGAADAVGIDAIYWNPAGLAETQKRRVSFVRNNYIAEIDNNYLAMVYPMKKAGTLGVAIYHVDIGYITRTEVDAAGNPVTNLGVFDAYDMAMMVSYGKSATKNMSFGTTVKYIRSKIENEDASAYALDGGLQYQITRPFSVGFAFQNLGTKMKYRSQKNELPLNYRFGLAFQTDPGTIRWRVGADMNVPAKNKIYYNGGIEVLFYEIFALRFGYDHRNRDVREWFTGGFGLRIGTLSLDYAYTPYGVFKNSHRIGFGFEF